MSKIWLFYKIRKGDDYKHADVYAATDNYVYAESFKDIRGGLIRIEKDLKKSDIKRIRDICKSQWIIEDQLWTRKVEGDTTKAIKVSMLLTEKESIDIKLHAEGFLMFLLGSVSVSPMMFAEDIRNALRDMGMADVWSFSQQMTTIHEAFRGDSMFYPWYEGEYKLDELSIFLQMAKDTFDNIEKEEK